MRDGAVIAYRQTNAGVKPYFRGSLLRWLSANYEAQYGFSSLSTDREHTSHHTLRQNLFVTFFPSDNLHFTAGMEHYLTRFPYGNHANLILLDASAVWKASNKARISLTACNLLDKRRYEYVEYGTLSRSEHRFSIRARSIVAVIQYRF